MNAADSPRLSPPDRYGVVGHPIAHSKSPFIHAQFAAATGQHMVYERYDIAPEDFVLRLREFFDQGGCGLNVTLPHKEAAARFADRLTPRARLAGAVNTLRRCSDGAIEGDNTDGAGLLADLQRLQVQLTGASVVILGAGGATRGILAPLLQQHPASVYIANRSAQRALQLVQDFAAEAPVHCRLRGGGFEQIPAGPADLVLHATSLGLEGKVPAVPSNLFGSATLAYDLGYGITDTPFTLAARAQGAGRVAQGLGMLIEQAAEAFWIWRGIRPDTTSIRHELQA
ncbi:MAG: shikimate dehydrogenase [Sinobacteraceae bacterium]|nr:shikimate dehydrogenase [Nevskiaceae bacterium]